MPFGKPNIAKLKDKGDVMGLIKALGHKDGEVLGEAVHALGLLRDERAVDPLIRLGIERSFWRPDAAEALVKIGPAAVEPLIGVLGSGDEGARDLAATALGDLGYTRAVEPLISALKDESHAVRWVSVEALGKLGDTRAVDALILALKENEDYYVKEAAEALGKLGDARAVGALGDSLRENEDDDVREAAAEALGRIGDPLAVEPLITALGDSSGSVRGEAERWLANMGPAAVEALNAHLAKKRGEADRAAMERELATPMKPRDLVRERVKCRQCGQYMTSAVTAFGPMGEEGIVVLVKMESPAVDGFVCGECGAGGLKNFVIESPHEDPRKDETTTDKATGETRARARPADSLIASLGSRRTALEEPEEARALIEMGGDAVPALIDSIAKSSFIPLILGRIGDTRAVEALMELAQTPARFHSDPDAYGGYACEMAVHGLGLLGDRRALRLLKDIAAETNVGEILMAANQAIEQIEAGSGGVPTALEDLSDFQLEGLAKSESTPPETLEALVDHPSRTVQLLAAGNPALSEATLRRKFAEDSGMHPNLLLNPSCPSDVLSEIVKLGRVSNARYQAERHPNWRG